MFTDDKDIERELRAALEVAPSSDFEAGVLRRIERDRPSRRLAAPAWLAVAAAVVLGVSAWILGAREEGPLAPETVSVTHPVSADPPPPSPPERPTLPATPAAPEPVRRPGRTSHPPVAATAAAAAPEVIVPANQLELIRRFLRAVNTGRVEPSESTTAEAELEELIVPPLTVRPIPIVTLEPGGGSSPGPKGLQ
jgi:hypothetical protein